MGKTLEEMRKELETRQYPVASLEEFNNRPDVKGPGIMAVYKKDEEAKEKKIEDLSKFNKILFAILIGFLICAATFAYLAYTDKLKFVDVNIPDCIGSPVNVTAICQSTQCNCANACPQINITCAPEIKVYTNST